jgi:flagellar capping protein FliD
VKPTNNLNHFSQELLQERRRERDKENQRQKDAIRQMETSLSAREKIFKERINGLEGQVDVLKDQLSKEMRRRQTFITGQGTFINDVTHLGGRVVGIVVKI